MRALVLLVLAALILWGIQRFSGASDVRGGEAVPLAAPEAASLPMSELAPELGSPDVGASRTPDVVPAEPTTGRFVASPPPKELAAPAVGDLAASSWSAFASGSEEAYDASELGNAVLHLDGRRLAQYLQRGPAGAPEEHKRLCLAFVEALEGSRESALARVRGLEEGRDFPLWQGDFLRAALADPGAETLPPEDGPLARAMAMRLHDREAETALAGGEEARAARLLSELLVGELDAPWPSDRPLLDRWSRSLEQAQRSHRFHPKGRWPSIDLVVEPGDSLTTMRKRAIASRPGLVVNVGLIEQVNRIGQRYLQAGELVRVPLDPIRTLVDLDARWVLVFAGDEVLAAYPCGIGAEDTETVTGRFTVGDKQENPMWFPRGREPVAFGDPENPLGTRWVAWLEGGTKTSYGFHGTSDPESIGQASSEGCIRLHNEQVEVLYELLPKGSTIEVRP